MRSPIVRRRVTAGIVSAFLVLVFVSIVAFLRAFKPEAAGFELNGWPLRLYHASRLGLALYITIFCYSAGYRALELFQVSPQGLFNSARKTFILCFFFGASLFGIAFTVLGLAGLISLESGLALTIPVLLFSYRPIKALLPERFEAATFQSFLDTHASPFFGRVVILVAVGAALLFLLTRVVFIPTPDGNVWEHYLHYYRAVLASGSTQPNEVWHHFYASKGAGLVFLAIVLSDFFGVQLVSACFVAVAGLIILDLLLEYCRSTSWAFFGVMLFFTYLCGDVSSGAMFRVHGVLLGYASFALWGSVWLQQVTARQFRPLMVALVVSLTYLGFYLPVAAVIFPVAFLLLVLMNVMLREKTRWPSFLTLACGLFAGSALAFVTNWVLTGLPEVTPMRWFWAIADRMKVEEVFGTGGVEFFLAMNNNLEPNVPWSRLLRFTMYYPLPMTIMYVSLLGLLIVLTRMVTRFRANGTVAKPDKFLMQLAAFVIPLGVFVLVVPSPSVYRMGLYSIVFMTLGVVVIWKRFVDIYVGGLRLSLLGVEADDKGTPIHHTFRLWHAATVVIIVFGMVAAFAQARQSIGKQWLIIREYVKGAMSLKDSMQAVESLRVPLGRRPSGTSIAAMSDFRRTTGPDGRILSLMYDPGYSYLLPGGGIVSEPTYSLIRNPRKILAEKSNEVADYLRERNIRYFTLNLQSSLFSTIAFTSLFDVREMPRYFSVAYEDGDFFILSWRKSDQEKRLPDYLLTLFELKRTGVLHYPFTERFAKLVLKNGNQLVDNVAGFEKARDEFREDLDKAFSAEVLPLVSLETSKALLRRILDAGKDAVDSANPGKVASLETSETLLRRILDAGKDSGHVRIVEKVSQRELKARLLKLFRDAIYREYEVEVGSEIASLSRNCDERVPFVINYPTDATC